MNKTVLFLMTQKGYEALKHFIELFGSSHVSFVVGAKDESVQQDFYREIKELCEKKSKSLLITVSRIIKKNK